MLATLKRKSILKPQKLTVSDENKMLLIGENGCISKELERDVKSTI
jgi:hypothetical protein